ncbi:BnaCnng22030D [Brassica napus]|uniref:BnaCnng22030D protein n=1 Tax=Brassica napus TaxID=3708 RepID=A0A078IM13_BRANA|nr:BnaCnng22030D [Brassica napus]
MVSQSNAAGSSGRRCRPNTPKAKPVSRSKKMKRYPVSDSDDDTTPSSMDSTAPTSPPVDAVDVGTSTKFPRRLFAPRFFSTQLRLNIYSKANVIASVASALKGSSAMDCSLAAFSAGSLLRFENMNFAYSMLKTHKMRLMNQVVCGSNSLIQRVGGRGFVLY